MKKRRIYFYPRTKLGKISFWLVLIGIVVVYSQYWISLAIAGDNPDTSLQYIETGLPRILKIAFSLIALAAIIIGGLSSIISIIKYKERSIFSFISAIIGLLGILFLLGEFLVPH